LFFSSGLCALIYQVLWLRMLGWVFGVTVHAASTVWTAFMAGLAIGSVAAGYCADRIRSPLKWFGITEAMIGVTAFATPAALAWLQRAYAGVHPSLADSPGALTLARLAIRPAACRLLRVAAPLRLRPPSARCRIARSPPC
jgi:spermidine synthase